MRLIENTSRVLNLIALEKSVSRQAAASTLSSQPSERFFCNELLNRAIFLKHNVRAGERHLFETHGHVETKILIPFDGSRFDLGARSFFIDESGFGEILRNFLKIDPDAEDENTRRDLKVLETLKNIPSFDPFVLRESLRCADIKIDPRYFSASYNEMKAATEAVYADIKPLIESALGKEATGQDLVRFVEQAWNVDDATSTNLFFETLRIPRSEWPDIVFAWKALLYYRLKTRKDDHRLYDLVIAMKQVRLSNNINMCSPKELNRVRHHLAQHLFQLKERALTRAESLSQALVNGFSVDFEVAKFREILRELSVSIVALGTDVTVYEQVVSYYMHLFGQRGRLLDGVVYETTLRSLDEIVSLRFGVNGLSSVQGPRLSP
jgi:hypothetical protein